MEKLKRKQGITLTVLVITVVVLMIIGGTVIYNGITEVQQAQENKALSEAQIVQGAVLQAYTNYTKTKNETFLAGTQVTQDEMTALASELGITLVTIPSKYYDEDGNLTNIAAYYRLSPLVLEEIGIYESEDTYVVNYFTGETINATLKKTRTGKPLYTYSVNNYENNDVTAF